MEEIKVSDFKIMMENIKNDREYKNISNLPVTLSNLL